MNTSAVCRGRFESACTPKLSELALAVVRKQMFLLLGNGLHKRKTTVVSFMFSADT
jgi:hypothetical protein